MRISARNRLQGKIVEVTKGATTAYVKIDVRRHGSHRRDHQRGGRRAWLKAGDAAYAVIKASDVMVGKD